MAKKSNGEPHISVVNFGSYYCSMWRWDDVDHWKFLNNKTGGRRLFESATLAISETMRIKMAEKRIRVARAEPEEDDLGTKAWRAQKDSEAREERRKVFGANDRPKIVFCNGKVVQVETARRARV